MNNFKYELPSTLIRLFMGQLDYELYMDSKDEPFDSSDGIIETSSEI